MRLEDLTFEVRNKNLERVGVITHGEVDAILNPRFNQIGTWKLVMRKEHPLVAELRKPGAGLIVTGPDGVLLSGPVVSPHYKAGADDPQGKVTISGVTDMHILGDRLAYPDPQEYDATNQHYSHDVREGSVEAVMHGFVANNVGPNAPAGRRHPKLDMGPMLNRGRNVKKSARFPVLGNLLSELAPLADMGFRIVQQGSRLVFETYQVEDRSKLVRLDIRNGTAAAEEVQTAGPTATRVIVAGQGDLVDRQFVERSDAESVAAEQSWGRRIERFVDQRQTDDWAELIQAGDEVLAKEGREQLKIKTIPADDATMIYGKDWNLGDRITVVTEGRELADVVVGVYIQANAGGFQLGAEIGSVDDEDNGSVNARVSNLERNVEGGNPGGGVGQHSHDASDILTGTFQVARIPQLGMSKITGLTDALLGKSDTGHGHGIGEITGWSEIIDAKADKVHSHPISQVTNLQATLDGKAAEVHGHVVADIDGLQAELDEVDAAVIVAQDSADAAQVSADTANAAAAAAQEDADAAQASANAAQASASEALQSAAEAKEAASDALDAALFAQATADTAITDAANAATDALAAHNRANAAYDDAQQGIADAGSAAAAAAAAQSDADAAAQAAAAAQSDADAANAELLEQAGILAGKGTVYWNTVSNPPAGDPNGVWIRVGKPYKWNGSQWVEDPNPELQQAIDDAAQAKADADAAADSAADANQRAIEAEQQASLAQNAADAAALSASDSATAAQQASGFADAAQVAADLASDSAVSADGRADAAEQAASLATQTANAAQQAADAAVADAAAAVTQAGEAWDEAVRKLDAGEVQTAIEGATSEVIGTVGSWTKTGTVFIDGGKLYADSVTATQIAANAITANELAANAIEAGHITSGAVIAGKIAANAVTAGTIAANAVTAGKVNADAITGREIKANSIVADHISANAIIAEHISTDAITAAHILAGSITAEEIDTDSIRADILTADVIKGTMIDADAITAEHIVAGSITATEISASSIRAAVLTADAIKADMIDAGQINVSHLAAGTLSVANLTGGTLDADVVIGGAIKTSNSYSDYRVTIDGSGIKFQEPTHLGARMLFRADSTGVSVVGNLKALHRDTLGNESGIIIETRPSDPMLAADALLYFQPSVGAPYVTRPQLGLYGEGNPRFLRLASGKMSGMLEHEAYLQLRESNKEYGSGDAAQSQARLEAEQVILGVPTFDVGNDSVTKIMSNGTEISGKLEVDGLVQLNGGMTLGGGNILSVNNITATTVNGKTPILADVEWDSSGIFSPSNGTLQGARAIRYKNLACIQLYLSDVNIPSGGQNTPLGSLHANFRPGYYYASWSGWMSGGVGGMVSGLCQSTGGMSIRWASAASTSSSVVLTACWPTF